MFHRVLVPVDFTPKNGRALEQARDLVERSGGELLVVHVVETLEDELDADLAEFYRKLEERAEERVKECLKEVGEGDFTRRSAIVLGHRARAITDFAEHEKVDLIVLSSHRVDPDKPGHDWMTISYKIAILARCPVLLVK